MPSPRSAATIAGVNSKLYLFGGLSNDCGWLGDFFVFDTGRLQQQACHCYWYQVHLVIYWVKSSCITAWSKTRLKLTFLSSAGNSQCWVNSFYVSLYRLSLDLDQTGQIQTRVLASTALIVALFYCWAFVLIMLLIICAAETRTWSKPSITGTGPSPRDKLASAAVGQNIYYFGGFGPKTTPVRICTVVFFVYSM